jgi:hypothetical protein
MAAKTNTTPRQARNHPTLEVWLLQEQNIEWLKQLVADERFLAVCHYVTDEHRVTSSDLAGPQPMLPEVIVRKAALHAGATEFVDGIKRLLTKAPKPKTNLPEAWEHIHPPTL